MPQTRFGQLRVSLTLEQEWLALMLETTLACNASGRPLYKGAKRLTAVTQISKRATAGQTSKTNRSG